MATAGMVLALALVATGCGAGQTAPTSQDLPSVPGVNIDSEGIAVRNAAVVFDPEGYAPGDTAPIELSIFNDTASPVSLLEAVSPVAGSVTVEEGDPTIPAYDYVAVTLAVTDLTTGVDATESVPLELAFSNGVTLTMEVPVAPPLEREGVREPADL